MSSTASSFGSRTRYDLVFGGFGDDILYGGEGNDVIDAHYGDDVIHGGGGNDLINGGYGNDTMIGGAGRDQFYIDTGINVIQDFDKSEGDYLTLDRYLTNVDFTQNGEDVLIRSDQGITTILNSLVSDCI